MRQRFACNSLNVSDPLLVELAVLDGSLQPRDDASADILAVLALALQGV